MTSLKTRKPQWTLTAEAFRQFLRRLHPDPEQAGLVYESLRLKLSYYFEARNCALPDALTDETINRLIRKVSEEEDIIHLERYAYTVARFVYLESLRITRPISIEDSLPEDDLRAAWQVEIQRREIEEELLRSGCMKKCLAKLPPEQQQLLIEYYQGIGQAQTQQRQRLANARGMTINALYLQVHRVREKLEECLANCLKSH